MARATAGECGGRGLEEYRPGTAFPGVVGRTFDQSSAAWPEPLRAREGMANVLFIILDDTGFGQLGCYGSPIRTPNLDRLAADGLRYNNMHTTALCSPTRSCMLTGRNHHSNHHGRHHRGLHRLPGLRRLHPLRERLPLRDPPRQGYNTYASASGTHPGRPGSAAGPYDRWPRAGASTASTGSWAATPPVYPELVAATTGRARAEARGGLPPHRGPGRQGDRVRRRPKRSPPTSRSSCTSPPGRCMPRTTSPGVGRPLPGRLRRRLGRLPRAGVRPPEGAGHRPGDAELSRHDPDVTPWDDCSADERRLYARMMEVFAGFLSTPTTRSAGCWTSCASSASWTTR